MSSAKRNGGKHTTAYTYETVSDGGQTGRVKTVKNGSHSENYTYDTWGNVTKVTENSSQTGKAYAYDAQGQLIREYDPDKKIWLGYKYDADYYYIRDGLMCITGLVDANGAAVVNYKYDSWGKLISVTGSCSPSTYVKRQGI